MNSAQQSIPGPRELVRILAVHARRWLVPAAVVGVLAAVYAVARPDTWEASQALIVRNEAANKEAGPGKFSQPDEMKTVQETILELVKSRGVLTAALKEVGPPADYRKNQAAWPTARDVAEVRKTVKLLPPKGAEFGKTEVFYLKVRDHDRGRVVALNRAICDQLQARFQQLRDAKARSMTDELVKAVHLAKADLDESTARLSGIERQVGSDLAELRALNQAGNGDSALRRTITEIRNELRQTRAIKEANRQLLALLSEAWDDPGRLLATPNRLLESQPALRRLKDGLVDAQLNTASLKGSMSDEHPLVRSAKGSEEEIGRHLHEELAISIRGLEVELRLNSDRAALLEDDLAQATERLGRLAGLRATYSNQLAETANRAALLERAEQNLAEARATRASAKAASLISRIDAPDSGINPVGPSRAMIVLIGAAGGLLTGFGVLFLTVQPRQPSSEDTRLAEHPARSPLPSVQPAVEPAESVLQPRRSLSVKQALHKIEYGSTV